MQSARLSATPAVCVAALMLNMIALAPAAGVFAAPQDPEGAETNSQADLVRTAFVMKDGGGRAWVFVRLTSAQSTQTKITRTGATKIVLTPRQRQAVRMALSLPSSLGPVTLRVAEKRIQFSQSLGGRYVARSADVFRAWGARGGEESQPDSDQPPEGLLAGIR
jgi:hypothetical protein